MCHNSGIESEQIERYMAFGLPQKAVRSVKYTMRKREKQQRKEKQEQQDQSQNNSDVEDNVSASSSSSSNSDSGTDVDIKPKRAVQQKLIEKEMNIEKIAIAEVTAAQTEEAASVTVLENSKSDIFRIPKFCGRFRKMQEQQQEEQQQKQQQQPDAVNSLHSSRITTVPATATTTTTATPAALTAQQQRKLSSMEPSMDDALAIGTQMTRKFAERCHCLIAQLHGTRLYTILTRTTQPAHLMAILILSFVLLTVGPDLRTTTTTTMHSSQLATAAIHTTTTTTTTQAAAAAAAAPMVGSTLATLAYLGAFATHFGSQIWMTFVSGLSLYFSLPRHTFGQCQQILFPKYFALNAMLSISMLIIYVKYFLSGWTTAAGVQMGTLALTAAIEVVVRLYLAPPMLRLMHEKYRIEGAIGSGQEVGSLVQGDLVECPHYQRIHKAFRRIHMTIAIGNMIVLMATCLQLYFLALKIRIS